MLFVIMKIIFHLAFQMSGIYQLSSLSVISFLCTGYSSRHLLQAAWQGNVQLVKKLLVSKRMQLCKMEF